MDEALERAIAQTGCEVDITALKRSPREYLQKLKLDQIKRLVKELNKLGFCQINCSQNKPVIISELATVLISGEATAKSISIAPTTQSSSSGSATRPTNTVEIKKTVNGTNQHLLSAVESHLLRELLMIEGLGRDEIIDAIKSAQAHERSVDGILMKILCNRQLVSLKKVLLNHC
jgi:hypothetical protein